MLDTRIILSGLWVASMLTFLWGDVLTIFSGDVVHYGRFNDDSDCYGCAVPDIEISRDSLGKHRGSHIVGCFYSL